MLLYYSSVLLLLWSDTEKGMTAFGGQYFAKIVELICRHIETVAFSPKS